jgi:predicted nucleic acid-binding protein
VAMNFLADTNVFLEILLDQSGRTKCETFLKQNLGRLAISDFSLHSLGVIALRQKKPELFAEFLQDTLPNLELIHLDRVGYPAVARASQLFNLDFDDAYQFTIAQAHGLAIATQDHHFERVKDKIEVSFL